MQHMERSYWKQQTKEKPLFPELEWSRPQNRLHAGKLLIVGGNTHGFAAPAEAYGHAIRAGAGQVRVLLPSAIQKLVGAIVPEAIFAPSTQASGSFSQKALAELIEAGAWADGVLLAGDMGRNAETAILIEKFLVKSEAPITLTKDTIDYAFAIAPNVLARPNTLLVLTLAQLQRLGIAAKHTRPLRFDMDLLHLVEWLHDFTRLHKPYLIVKHHDYVTVAVDGQVSTTLVKNFPIWRLKTATHAAVWWIQHQNKPFQAITSSIL